MLLCSHTTLKVFHFVKNILLYQLLAIPLRCDLETNSPYRRIEGAGYKQHIRDVMKPQAVQRRPCQRMFLWYAVWRLQA